MLKKEYELLIPFVTEPWKKRTFKEIKRLCNKTSESYVYNSLKKYVNEKILSEEKIGRAILYYLNLAEPKTRIYSGFISEHLAWRSKRIPVDILKKVIEKIPTPYFSFIVTGSYAKNKQKETSDIDIVILVDDKQDTKYVRAQIHYTCELSIPPVHHYVFKKSEFLEMLLNDEANYGKEVVRHNLIFIGGSGYFQLIREAMKNGFNDKSLS